MTRKVNSYNMATGYFAPHVWNLSGDAFTDVRALRLLHSTWLVKVMPR